MPLSGLICAIAWEQVAPNFSMVFYLLSSYYAISITLSKLLLVYASSTYRIALLINILHSARRAGRGRTPLVLVRRLRHKEARHD